MQTKKIFLASSEELRADRVAFELMINQLNQDWVPRDIFFHLVTWENFVDAMSKDGLQQEYNRAIRDCDIFVMLFFTKVGPYTAEEFEAAFGAFQSGKKPLIYTYFKDDLVLTGKLDRGIVSLLDFKEKLTELKHYVTRYRSAEELKWLFGRQLDKLYGDTLAKSLEITDTTPQTEIDTIALTLANRFLSGVDARAHVDVAKLSAAVQRAGEMTRHTIFLVAERVRRMNWSVNKSLMEQTLPIFEAIVAADPHKHYYFGQLGYAQKDRVKPDWAAAKKSLDQALSLLPDEEASQWPYYGLNRAICVIKLDPGFAAGRASSTATKKAIVEDLRNARSGLGIDFERIVDQPETSLRQWLQLNGHPRLD